MGEVTEAAVDLALNAAVEHHRQARRDAREAVWVVPSRGQVRAMLEAAAPDIADRAVADAGLENTRRDAQLFALASVMPAVLDALRAAAADAKYEAQAKRFTAALEVLGGSDDKEAATP